VVCGRGEWGQQEQEQEQEQEFYLLHCKKYNKEFVLSLI